MKKSAPAFPLESRGRAAVHLVLRGLAVRLAHILLQANPEAAQGCPPAPCTRSHMIVLKHVLVATDFGEVAGVALAYGRELARTFGATLHVVHVVDDLNSRVMGLAGFPEHLTVLTRVQEDNELTAQAALDHLLTEEDRRQLHAKSVLLVSATPAGAILDYAKDALVDLIVAGTHGRGAVAHFFMGSVTERLVRSAVCPVLTVRHPEHEFLRQDALQTVARA